MLKAIVVLLFMLAIMFAICYWIYGLYVLIQED